MVIIWGLREGNGEFLFHEHRDCTLEDEKKFQSWVVTKVAPKCEYTYATVNNVNTLKK